MRPSFEEICMGIATTISRRSTCLRTNSAGHLMQVGCVIVTVDFRKVLAWGYNGNASGLPNECDSSTPGACGCLHAEENAVINCDVARSLPKVLFCTHLPCVMCAKRIINLGGVTKVLYTEDYRIKDALKLLDAADIQHERVASP